MKPVEVIPGDGPVVLGMPHCGTDIPVGIAAQLTKQGAALTDTDWHIDRLYADTAPDATIVRATFHRYVIDANRDPSGASLYPGRNTTGLVPLTNFDGACIWRSPPSASDIESRRKNYHAPYHAALAEQLERVRASHGAAVLYDCHSIRSRVPFLFEGRLADLNIGTNGGVTCAPEIEAAVVNVCEAAPDRSYVLNGHFMGGWTVRHYGRPAENIHAVQMEMAQSVYLAAEAPPWTYDPEKAGNIRIHLAQIMAALTAAASQLGGGI